MSASIAIQILPQADSDEEICRIVDEVIAYTDSTGLHYEVSPFETAIEGENLDELLEVAKECQHVAARAGARKVSSYIKTVFRPQGEVLTIDQKVGKYRKGL